MALITDQELLWKAFPSGCVARRGVMTIGMYQYVGDGDLWIELGSGQRTKNVEALVKFGMLLPVVNIDDTPTWAQLLVELCERLEVTCKNRDSQEVTPKGLRLSSPSNYGEGWTLEFLYWNNCDGSYKELPGVLYGDPDYAKEAELPFPTTQEPEMALVLCLAHLNETKKDK